MAPSNLQITLLSFFLAYTNIHFHSIMILSNEIVANCELLQLQIIFPFSNLFRELLQTSHLEQNFNSPRIQDCLRRFQASRPPSSFSTNTDLAVLNSGLVACLRLRTTFDSNLQKTYTLYRYTAPSKETTTRTLTKSIFASSCGLEDNFCLIASIRTQF